MGPAIRTSFDCFLRAVQGGWRRCAVRCEGDRAGLLAVHHRRRRRRRRQLLLFVKLFIRTVIQESSIALHKRFPEKV
ncbi:hypothetical protein chiPu_0007150 [Chiloscyllium punctatum]|uniref:Uncharacterized protein n=1 Tax=Chiloscyllium punctatum TaxID=137246 RepID=A0A401SE80_CHIPU|nr:hypothetical protein [Chiloscyllium punctatum]